MRDASCLVGSVEVVDQDRELVAAEPGDRVEVTEVFIEAIRDCDQEGVAGEVSEAVVHVLEPVEVDDHDCDVPADACSAGEGMFEAVIEQCPVRQTGEWVVGGLSDQAFLAFEDESLVRLGGEEGLAQDPQNDRETQRAHERDCVREAHVDQCRSDAELDRGFADRDRHEVAAVDPTPVGPR